MPKIRLDNLLVERGLAESRSKAQALLLAGSVRVNGQPAGKPGTMVDAGVEVELTAALPYASRGGYKLAHALDTFGLDPRGLACLDVGASTGGFTDVLLQRGAALIYAVDVGYGILDYRLRSDPRVVSLERTNIRYLESLPQAEERGAGGQGDKGTGGQGGRGTGGQEDRASAPAQGAESLQPPPPLAPPAPCPPRPLSPPPPLAECAVIDVSFISLRLVLPAVRRLIVPGAWVVALIKPQFEAGAELVGKGGVVRDPAVHRAVLRAVLGAAAELGLTLCGLARSPITGPAGNSEFLAWLQEGGPPLSVPEGVQLVCG